MVGQLLVRSLDRSDHVYNAMLARGYDGRLLTLNPHQMKGRDWLWGTSGAVLIGLIQVIGRMY
jgi:cobalt/nickel transport system permease protein